MTKKDWFGLALLLLTVWVLSGGTPLKFACFAAGALCLAAPILVYKRFPRKTDSPASKPVDTHRIIFDCCYCDKTFYSTRDGYAQVEVTHNKTFKYVCSPCDMAIRKFAFPYVEIPESKKQEAPKVYA